MSMYVSVHMSEGAHGDQRRVLDTLNQSYRQNSGSGNQTQVQQEQFGVITNEPSPQPLNDKFLTAVC